MIYYRKTLFGSGPKLTAVQLFVVAFLLQLSMAAAHINSPKRTMVLTMGITTALIIAVITPLALSVNHYSGSIEVPKSALNEVHAILSK